MAQAPETSSGAPGWAEPVRRRLPVAGPYVVLAAALALTLAAWSALDDALHARAAAEFGERARDLVARVGGRVHDTEQVLRGAAGLFAASEAVTTEEWSRYVSALRLGERHPGLQGVGFAAWPRGEGPATIVLLEPSGGDNRAVFGFDLASERVRRAALERARDGGGASLTAPVVLVQDEAARAGGPAGVLLVLPVYRHGATLATVEQRREALLGIVFSPLRMRHFVPAALGRPPEAMAFELRAPPQPAVLYDSLAATAGPVATAARSEHQATIDAELLGQTWRFRFHSLPGYVAGLSRTAPRAVLAFGLLASALLFGVTLLLARSRAGAVSLANALQEREALHRTIFEAGPFGIVVVDPDTLRWVAFNDQAARQLGYSREEFARLSVRDVDADPDPARVDARGRIVLERGQDDFEAVHRGKDGALHDVSVVARLIRARGRRAVLSFWRDVTEQRRAAALRQRDEQVLAARLALIDAALGCSLGELLTRTLDLVEDLTGSRIGFYHFVDGDGAGLTLQAWSTRTLATFCRAEGIGSHLPADQAGIWADAVRERRAVVHDDYAAAPGRTGLPEGHAELLRELVVPVLRGGRVVAVLGVGNKPSSYGEEDVALVSRIADLSWDIAERKAVQERLHDSERQLAQAQRLESIGRLAGGVAHDFNNMLSVILGHSEALLAEGAVQGEAREDLAEIRDAARRAALVTRQLLAFARKQDVQPRVVDLNDAVGAVLKMLRRLIGEDIDLRWTPGAELRPVRIDPSQLDQLLANLCVNSRDAIAGVGHVDIETANVELDAAFCGRHPGLTPGRFVRLTVRDDGGGIAPGALPHIFEPFFTTKESGQGTGLGLAMVYGIVRQNGGAIEVDTAPGRGTTFHVHLPAVDAPAEAPAGGRAAGASGGEETVLLVEDERAVLRLCTGLLERLGYRVLSAPGPEEALRLVARHEGRLDLLVTDVIMPGMNGRELASVLQRDRPGLRCLFMSGYTADALQQRGVSAERTVFLQKPFTPDELGAKVREALGVVTRANA